MWTFNTYAILPLLSGVVSLAIAVFAFGRRQIPAAWRLFLLMAAMGSWALVFALNVSLEALAPKVILWKMGAVLAQLVVLAVLSLSFELTGNSGWLTRRRHAFLWVLPAFVLCLSLTTDFHHLFAFGFSIERAGTVHVLAWKTGPLFTVHYLYLMALILVSTGLYAAGLVRASGGERARYAILVAVTVLPAAVDLLLLTPVKGLSMVHSTFWLAGLAYAFAISRYNLIDLVPIARQRLFDEMTDPVLIAGDEGVLAEANAAARRTFGLTARCIGAPVGEVFAEYPGLAAALGGDGAGESAGIAAAGRFWHLTMTGVHDPGTRRGGRLVVFRDITDLKAAAEQTRRAREDAERMSAAKSRFLGVMGHEMRTPLHSMLGSVEMLAETRLDESQQRLVALLERSGRTLRGLVDDALDRTLIEAGRMTLTREPVSLRQLLDDVRDLFAGQASRKGLALRIELSADVPGALVTDRRRLLQVFTNLVGNAVRYTDTGSIVVGVSALRHGTPRIVVTVRDTGPGIGKERLPGLFEPFTGGGAGERRARGGVGLGLSITRDIVVLMGGDIKVESTPGAGSTFEVTLPLEEAGVGEQPVHAGGDVALPAGLRLLVVDDVPENREIVKLILAPFGVALDEAEDGPQAVTAFGAVRYDCVLLDMHLPSMDGVEVVRLMRRVETGRRTPIVAVSADASADAIAAALQAGCDDYLVRPVGRGIICGAIGRTLGRSMTGAAEEGPPGPILDALRADAVVRCREYAQRIADAARCGDFKGARRLGHSVRGLGMTFGIAAAERVGTAVEEASLRGDAGACTALAQELEGG